MLVDAHDRGVDRRNPVDLAYLVGYRLDLLEHARPGPGIGPPVEVPATRAASDFDGRRMMPDLRIVVGRLLAFGATFALGGWHLVIRQASTDPTFFRRDPTILEHFLMTSAGISLFALALHSTMEWLRSRARPSLKCD